MESKKNIFVFDVESTDLHGKGFAVGAIVLDAKTGEEVDSFLLKSFEGEKDSCEWVKTNVLPWLKDYPAVATGTELRNRFWKFYLEHKDDCEVWADVAYPVETNFLEEVYRDDPENRAFAMPYPLCDISSHVDVNVDRVKFSELMGLEKHNPFHDALASAFSLFRVSANKQTDMGIKGDHWALLKTTSKQQFFR